MHLHNRIDRKILKQQISESKEERITLSFYQYAHIGNPNLFRDHLYLHWSELGVLGRVYVAHEGINAQINVPKENFSKFSDQLSTITFLDNIRLNLAVDDDSKSFYKLKIQVKKKIVADGLQDDTFDATNHGTHLQAEDFNALADDPNTVVVDMRNHYESEVGHFENAILPDADSFREALPIVEEILQPHRDKNIVMYCTGGIRCEKASAYFKHKGFEHVFQLEGGIINYARQVQSKGLPNKFRGKNFVFDERLGERISGEIISRCHQCGQPCDTHVNCKNEACHLLFIQCERCASTYDECCSPQCQEFIHLPEEEQRALRKAKQQKRNVFRKGRADHLKHWLEE
uniref:tRNA uridine(34) hydroxylase n=1 Tax=Roseihalotalea indica TaxID=2867963 RepID=A0AA49GQ30_9BACT|nr:rhodanese-related sulfurtransferase [Tunicatimonas sp. TK19036]